MMRQITLKSIFVTAVNAYERCRPVRQNKVGAGAPFVNAVTSPAILYGALVITSRRGDNR